MKGANFYLREWNTNDVVASSIFGNKQGIIEQKALGINWCTASNQISIDVMNILYYLQNLKSTKRKAMKANAKLYEPMGFLGSILVLEDVCHILAN